MNTVSLLDWSVRFEVGAGEGSHPSTVHDHYRQLYFEALDTSITGIIDRFDQPGYAVYKNLEGLLLHAINRDPYDELFKNVISFYKDDFRPSYLSAQLQNLQTVFCKKAEANQQNAPHRRRFSLKEALEYLRELPEMQRSFFSEVICLARLILVMPATNAVSERSFSALRRMLTYLRNTMKQDRLNHVMVLHLHKEILDNLDLVAVANEFVQGSEHRLKTFGKFT